MTEAAAGTRRSMTMRSVWEGLPGTTFRTYANCPATAVARMVPLREVIALGADGTLTSSTFSPRLLPVTTASEPLTATRSP